MTGTRPRAASTVSSITRSCSGKSSVGDSPVVPTGTRPSMPPLTWYSTCSRSRASSTLPSRKGVTIAVIAPLKLSMALASPVIARPAGPRTAADLARLRLGLRPAQVAGQRAGIHQVLHLPHRRPQPDEHGPADDGVADVQLAHVG